MNPQEKLDLKKLITQQGDYEDNTNGIRELKHSTKIRDDIRVLERLKTSKSSLRASDLEAFLEECKTAAWFLYSNYTDIFNKVCKDEIDLTIMTRMLTVLKLIEDGKVDQQEGSVMVGKILKELYIDSAMKRGDKLDQEYATEKAEPVEGKKISWKEYKQMSLM